MFFLLFLATALLAAPSAFAAERAFQLPTATEIFQLRSACAILGQNILDDNVVGVALSESQVSHYDPSTNRCYVEVDVQTADLTKGLNYLHRVLYDGQTGEMLASAKLERGEKSGMVFDKQHNATNLTNAGWDDASSYIDAKMADDRK